jgi:hypothetical protein
MKAIGIIANPASGQDIRRLVAYGTSISNADKISILRRIIMGASVTGIDTVYYMCDHRNLIVRALDGISSIHRHYIDDLNFVPADNPVSGREVDSMIAAENMVKAGVRCFITLGGDGTNRAVSLRSDNVPLIAISTGTNNVFPKHIEGTIAGQAAGIYASGCLPEGDYVRPTKRLEIFLDDKLADVALIDVAVTRSSDLASRALWKPEQIEHAFLTSTSVTGIGVSSLGVYAREVSEDEPRGVYIETSQEENLYWIPLVPGVMQAVGFRSSRIIEMGETVSLPVKTMCAVAVDGERNLAVPAGSTMNIKLTWNGPKVLDIRKVLSKSVEIGALCVDRKKVDKSES